MSRKTVGQISTLYYFLSDYGRESLLLHLKQIFPPMIWIFTEGDGIDSRLPFKNIIYFKTTLNLLLQKKMSVNF